MALTSGRGDVEGDFWSTGCRCVYVEIFFVCVFFFWLFFEVKFTEGILPTQQYRKYHTRTTSYCPSLSCTAGVLTLVSLYSC